RSASALFGSDIPILFARGNHENRGADSYDFLKLFPTSTGNAYYTFRQGPAFFAVLDGDEDKPDSDIRNLGLSCYDQFREDEAVWLNGMWPDRRRTIVTSRFSSILFRIGLTSR
ncbi:MAG: serine/threonine protein phosphatase, partial [Bacteroidales bacterium]